MALQPSGAISLNDMHIEAGGASGTQCSLNDADIRGLISKAANTTMSFNEWYNASSYSYDFAITNGSVVPGTGQEEYTGYNGYLGAVQQSIASFGSITTTSGIIPTNNGIANTLSCFSALRGGSPNTFTIRVGQQNTNSPYNTTAWLNNSVTISSSDQGANETTISNNFVGLSFASYFSTSKYFWQNSSSASGSNAQAIYTNYFDPDTSYSSTVYITI